MVETDFTLHETLNCQKIVFWLFWKQRQIYFIKCHSKVMTVAEMEWVVVTISIVWLLEQVCSFYHLTSVISQASFSSRPAVV